jgi:hypothetical protein
MQTSSLDTSIATPVAVEFKGHKPYLRLLLEESLHASPELPPAFPTNLFGT